MIDLQDKAFLLNLQGNILKSHGRSYTVHLLLRLNAEYKNTICAWLKHFAKNKVTSAYQQQQQSYQKQARIAGQAVGEEELFASVLLSAAGYRILGFDNKLLNDQSNPFAIGMANRPLNDPAQDNWEEPYKSGVHAMILLAHEDYNKLMAEVRAIEGQVTRFCEQVWQEQGKKLVKKFGWRRKFVVEHFGYAAGTSQQEQDQNEADTANIALVAEPTGDAYGSFMVFRKLQQNVDEFDKKITELAKYLGISREKAGAYVVGQYPDGTPLSNFEDDTEGDICPFQAHIRKMNPRGDLERNTRDSFLPELWDSIRIIRRSITYGDRPDLYPRRHTDRDKLSPPQEVGLLFMSFQAKLENFELLQIRANTENFIRAGVGLDALAGQGSATSTPQSWPFHGSKVTFPMTDLVTLKGGEYFFAPSLSFFQNLKADKLTEAQGKNLIQKTKSLYESETTLKAFATLWSKEKRIEAMESVLDVNPVDFDKFYAYLVPYMSILDAYTTDPYEFRLEGSTRKEEGTVSRSSGERRLDPAITERVITAFTDLFDPRKLEIFSPLWSKDPEQALASINLSIEDGDALYTYLENGGVNFRFGWPW